MYLLHLNWISHISCPFLLILSLNSTGKSLVPLFFLWSFAGSTPRGADYVLLLQECRGLDSRSCRQVEKIWSIFVISDALPCWPPSTFTSLSDMTASIYLLQAGGPFLASAVETKLSGPPKMCPPNWNLGLVEICCAVLLKAVPCGKCLLLRREPLAVVCPAVGCLLCRLPQIFCVMQIKKMVGQAELWRKTFNPVLQK